jgi:protein-arginine kinase activator protein McsA
MKCEQCGVRDATVHLSEIRDGVQVKQHLCLECAPEQADGSPGATIQEVLTKFVSHYRQLKQDQEPK